MTPKVWYGPLDPYEKKIIRLQIEIFYFCMFFNFYKYISEIFFCAICYQLLPFFSLGKAYSYKCYKTLYEI